MQHHFEANPVPLEEPQSAKGADPDRVLELFAGPRGNFMYYWYGSLYAVVEGFQKLQLSDQSIDALLGSPNVNALRRCRNGAFHFRPTYFSARSLKAISTDEFVRWVREVMDAFRGYFERQPRMDPPPQGLPPSSLVPETMADKTARLVPPPQGLPPSLKL